MLTILQVFRYYDGSSRTEMLLCSYMFLHWLRNLYIQHLVFDSQEGLQVRGQAKR